MKSTRSLIFLVVAALSLSGAALAQTGTPTETPTPTPTPTGASVSGTITYTGWISGTYTAYVMEISGTPTPVWSASSTKSELSAGKPWSATLPNGSYTFQAFWDFDGSGVSDNCDPSNTLGPFTIDGAAISNIDFGLADPCTPTITPTPTNSPTITPTPTMTSTPTPTGTPLPWPMFRHDARHTGESPYAGPILPQPEWATPFATGGAVLSSPAVDAAGNIYVGSNNDNLYSVNSNGTVRWNFSTPAEDISSSPAVTSAGTVYVGSQDNSLYALNTLTGLPQWAYVTGGDILSSPALGTDGAVYFGSYDTRLYAINPAGSLRWSFATGDEIYSSPAVGTDGNVAVGSRDDRVYSMNSSGAFRWSYRTGGAVQSSPAIGTDGSVLIGSDDVYLYRINSNATLAWSYRTGGNVRTCPAIGSDGSVYVSSFQTVYAFNSNGTLRGSYTAGGDVLSSVALNGLGRAYFGSDDNNFYIVGVSDGSLVWSFSTGGDVQSSPAISADGSVFFGSSDTYVYSVNSMLTPTPTPSPTPTTFAHYVELEVLPNQGRTVYHPGDKVALAWEVYLDEYNYRDVPVDIYVAARMNPPCTPAPTPSTGGSVSCAVTVEEIAASSGWLYLFNDKLNAEVYVAGTTPEKTFEDVRFPLTGGIVLGSLVFTVPKVGETQTWSFATAFLNKQTYDWVYTHEVIVSNSFELAP